MNDKLIISKYKELVEFYELLFDGDTLQHIHEAKLKAELQSLQEQESIKPIAVTSEEYYSRDKLFEWKKKEPTGNFEKFSLLKESESVTSFDTISLDQSGIREDVLSESDILEKFNEMISDKPEKYSSNLNPLKMFKYGYMSAQRNKGIILPSSEEIKAHSPYYGKSCNEHWYEGAEWLKNYLKSNQ